MPQFKALSDIKIYSKPASHMTYEVRDGSYCVHAWGVYPSSSVLAGQDVKQFVDTCATEEEVNERYPEAVSSHPMLQPQNTFDHLSENGDY
ncbi:hypothetical protein [Vibrio sp. R78045]|uniref:hypothetical protein n=1 Tax=Vibrio sp. R78045 TaxID=3093868 RepID=UPI0036F2E1B3